MIFSKNKGHAHGLILTGAALDHNGLVVVLGFVSDLYP